MSARMRKADEIGTTGVCAFLLRDFREPDAAEVSSVALAAFYEFQTHYSDWPALARIYGDLTGLIKNGEIIVAEIQDRIIGAVAYIPPGRPKAKVFQTGMAGRPHACGRSLL